MKMNIQEAVSVVGLFQKVSPKAFVALAACGKLRQFVKGEHLFFDKDPVETIYVVVSGLVSLYKTNAQGEKKVIFILDQGKLINEVVLQGTTASVNCEVFETAQVLCFNKHDFLDIMEHDFALTKGVLDSLSIKVRRTYRQLKNTSTALRGDKRVAAKLWKLSKDFGVTGPGGTTITLNLSITYLADLLGLKRETVSRQLKALAQQGLIRIENGRITILDCDKLCEFFKAP